MKDYLSLIKFSHTIFALPFALVGFFLGVLQMGRFEWMLLVYVLICMVTARSAAMAFNRYLDRDIDKANPRTAEREIPIGKISSQNALVFVIVNAIVFIATCYFINPLVLYLSPIALLITLGYSYAKRFTSMSHIILGLGLALAPVGAYLAVVGSFDWIPVLLGVSVMFWVAGFDIIYAMQDFEFDSSFGLNSTPVSFGKNKSMIISIVFHFISAAVIILSCFTMVTTFPVFGTLLWLGCLIFIGLLVYQHTLVKPHDLSKVNLAFFTTNGVSSVIFALCLILDIYL